MTEAKRITVLENGNLEIFIPAKLKNTYRRKLIISPEIEEDGAGEECPHVLPGALAEHLAQAHAWLGALESGVYHNVQELAGDLNVDPSYVGRILRLVNLAPDIQEAILNGTAPDSLTFNQLRGTIPDDWREQRHCLGFII